MVFTTQIFLFCFFPVCLLAYCVADQMERRGKPGSLLAKLRVRDCVLLVFSLVFYMWSCFDDLFKLLAYIVAVYLLARWVEAAKNKKRFIRIEREDADGVRPDKRLYLAVVPFVLAVVLLVLILVGYKYLNFLIGIGNSLFQSSIADRSLIAPLGLSFITFSAISYLADIYRGQARSGSLLDCALYLSFFPKVVSGPIVLWKDFQPQIRSRTSTWETCADGLNRIMIGFVKKTILADTFGACLASIGLTGIDRITAAGTLVLYMLQIYYDFSGYSDIAIGLARLFGFQCKENFHFPYRSRSISEFWRRWHISLGTWFREYCYIPLGGNRNGLWKTLRNLAVVFILTGIWHGAGWNYILWGAANGALVVMERLVQKKKFYVKTPGVLKYCGAMLIVMLLWQLFRFQNLHDVQTLFGIILGTVQFDTIPYTWQYFFSAKIVVLMVVGIIGATALGAPFVAKWHGRMASSKSGYIVQEAVLLVLFVTAILFMVNSTYSPFIYFQY